MSDDLDSIVKGAPIPGTTSAVSPLPPAAVPEKSTDPLQNTPSSPSMIYLNLLVLEASLRAQYLQLRARRRHHTFFLLLLAAWTAGFGYALFFAPREDGRGQGGSVYWGVEVMEKLCFMGGVITGVLVWGTGIWERGVRWPRRWLAVSNRGLWAFNCKLVLMKRPWWAEFLSTLAWFLTYGLFSTSATSSYRHVDSAILRQVDRELSPSHDFIHLPIIHSDEEKGSRSHDGHEEDLASGGDYVKLLLLPKPFSATFRENWELYRTEYWERENERRALLRTRVNERDKRIARERWGWLWWLPWLMQPATVGEGTTQRTQSHHQNQYQYQPYQQHHPRHSLVEREHRRAWSGSVRRGSVSSTRSPTPTVEVEECSTSRRASMASTASERRKKKPGLNSTKGSMRRRDSRSVTPDFSGPLSPLAKESSFGSEESTQDMGTRVLRS